MNKLFTAKTVEEKKDAYLEWLKHINSNGDKVRNFWEKKSWESRRFWIKTLLWIVSPSLAYVATSYFLPSTAILVLGCPYLIIQSVFVVLLFFSLWGIALYVQADKIKKELGL